MERGERFAVRVFIGKRVSDGDKPGWRWIGSFPTREEAETAEAQAKAEINAYLFKLRVARAKRRGTIAAGQGSNDHWVYICSNLADRILYVGITSNGVRRLRVHGNRKDWWPEVATVRVLHYPTAAAAKAEEKRLIAELQPPHNSDHRDPRGDENAIDRDARSTLDWEEVR
jgi:predicted GIY-YIG superfamily endonuclease